MGSRNRGECYREFPGFFPGFSEGGGGEGVLGVCSRAPLGRGDLQSCDPRAFASLRPWAWFFGPVGPGGVGGDLGVCLGRVGWAVVWSGRSPMLSRG